MATTKKKAQPAKAVKAVKKAPAAAPKTRRGGRVISAKFSVELNTPSDLRRVLFSLEKNVEGQVVIWKLHFELLERKAADKPYGSPIVKVDLELKKELESQADKIAKAKKLTPEQAAHALGPAANDQKAAKAGEIPQAEANDTVQDTVRQ